MHTSDRGSNFPVLPLSTCAGHPHMRMCRKLTLLPFHNSKGVLGIDLDGTKLSMYTEVCSAYPQNDMGNDE